MARFGGFSVGYVFHDTYRVVRRLGMGGMGVVFEVEHLRLPRRLALKVMTAPVTASSEYNMRFRQEAEIAASISHSNLVSVFDWNVTPDERLPYLVMELLTGEDLAQVLKRSGALPRPVAISILAQAVAALEVVHSHGIVHRDIKPANLFLCKNSIIPHFTKLLDFGIAKSTQPSPGLVTNNLVLMGTPAYMAPEQARGDLGPVGPRSDQFALGVVLYEMLSGRSAFHRAGEAAMSTLFRVMSEEPPALDDPALDAAVRRALRKRPDERYPSLSAMLSAIVGAAEVPVDEIAVPERTEKVVLRPVEVAPTPQSLTDPLAPTQPPVADGPAAPPVREASVARPLPAARASLLQSVDAVALVTPIGSVVLDGGGAGAGALSIAPAVAMVSPALPASTHSPASAESGRRAREAAAHEVRSKAAAQGSRRYWLLSLLLAAALAPLALSTLVLDPAPPQPGPQRPRLIEPAVDLGDSLPTPDLATSADGGTAGGSLCPAASGTSDPHAPAACLPGPSVAPTPPSGIRLAPRPRRPAIYVANHTARHSAVAVILDCVRSRLNDTEQWRLVNHNMQLVWGSDRRLVIYDDYWLSRPARHDLEYCLGFLDPDLANLKTPIYVKGEDPKP